MTGTTVLFRLSDGREPGSAVRGLALAQEVLGLVPDARVLVHVRDAAAATSCPLSVRCVVETGAGTGWRDVLAATAPDLAVYDTTAPDGLAGEPLAPHTRVATVLRRSPPDRHAEILSAGLLDRSDAVVVPHTRQEFGLPLPEAVERRTRFVGPLARRPDPRRHDGLRRRYGLPPGAPLLVSAAGEEASADGAAAFLAAVCAVQLALPRLARPVRHVVVLAPTYRGPVPDVPGADVVVGEPGLVDLCALADLVVSDGDGDAVAELRAVGTPAVFLLDLRRADDRSERLRALTELGVAEVVPDTAPGTAAAVVTGLLADPARLDGMRQRAAALPVLLGNRAAAEHLLGPLLRRGAA